MIADFEALWQIVGRAFSHARNTGRPPKYSPKILFEAMIFVAREGIRWSILPSRFPPPSTVHRWFQRWTNQGFFRKALRLMTLRAYRLRLLDLSRGFIDGTFIRGKNGSQEIGKTKCGKGSKVMVTVDRRGFPLAVSTHSASRSECQLVRINLQERAVKSALPKKLIGDKAYDSDPLDREMRKLGVEMIAPNRSNRVVKTQDRRKLRGYRNRWLVEDFNNRFQRFRKVLIRYERYLKNYEAFVDIATCFIGFQRIKKSL